MLRLSGVHTHYDQAHILRDVSLTVGSGEIVGLLGRNGAGKSTTMKAIIGAIGLSSGMITFRNQDLAKLKNYERSRLGIGYVPEDRRIFRNLTVLENLATGRQPAREGQMPWTIERVFELFPRLDELRAHLGGSLSGGEQQMLTIARSLMTNPTCLLLDEPTEGLAPVIVEVVRTAISKLRGAGLGVLLSEQNRRTALDLCNRIYVLEKGVIAFEGPPQGLTAKTQQLLGWV